MRVFLFAVPLLALAVSACTDDPEPMFGRPTFPPPRPLVRRVAPKPEPKPRVAGPVTPVAPGGPSGPLIVARDGKGISVARQGDDITVVVRNDRLFTSQGVLAGDDVLEPLGAVLDGYVHTNVTVNGFTDTSGTPDQNLEVSQKRTRQVADALAHEGVAAERITSQGLGESRLRIVTGDNKKEPRNRRIEIFVKARPG